MAKIPYIYVSVTKGYMGAGLFLSASIWGMLRGGGLIRSS